MTVSPRKLTRLLGDLQQDIEQRRPRHWTDERLHSPLEEAPYYAGGLQVQPFDRQIRFREEMQHAAMMGLLLYILLLKL